MEGGQPDEAMHRRVRETRRHRPHQTPSNHRHIWASQHLLAVARQELCRLTSQEARMTVEGQCSRRTYRLYGSVLVLSRCQVNERINVRDD